MNGIEYLYTSQGSVKLISEGGQSTSCSCPAEYIEVTYTCTTANGNCTKQGQVIKYCTLPADATEGTDETSGS